ncbi:MAG: DUF2723 domain-containing protein, partial [candidate division Zixibacteria bacterium]
FAYLLTVRMVGYFFGAEKDQQINRYIAYIGGAVGAGFVAFSETNWANSVESEVYGPSLAIMTLMFWLALRYFEERGTAQANKTMVLTYFIAVTSVGIHLTPFLMVPVLSVFFILKKDATPRDWTIICGFILLELLYIMLFADGRGGVPMFYLASVVTGGVVLALLYKKINWALAVAIGTLMTLMLGFGKFIYAVPIGIVAILILAYVAKKLSWQINWKTALTILILGYVGFSSHLYIPIRSAHDPRIDENNPDRDFQTFVNYLDRKQYGRISMTDRMFNRRGAWSNQLGRHPNMGFWSYFEEQYSGGHWNFAPFFILGLIGMVVAIYKRREIGIPFFTLFILCSVGLVLYMNFADGTKFNAATGDAYLEVRNRDYFFTPAFVFFGIAMGMGVAALLQMAKERLANVRAQQALVYSATLLILLPTISLAKNYQVCDRSDNYLPFNYAANLLDSCDENAILFTSGDNDTFPLWCLQEVYNYRRDVAVVNLSLLNTDWYVWQMKTKYDVPISLSKEQIWWLPPEETGQQQAMPVKPFADRPRGRMTYLQANGFEGRLVKVQDMMVDEIVLENKFRRPIYFSSQPYAESPLNLQQHTIAVGLVYRLEREIPVDKLDLNRSLELFENVYRMDGYEDSKVFRDENATGVFLGVGLNAVRLFDGLMKEERVEEAKSFLNKFIDRYPEYWQATLVLAEQLAKEGDSTASLDVTIKLHDTLTAFLESNPRNLFYMQDLGMVKADLGQRTGSTLMVEDGIKLMQEAFLLNPNSSYAFRKLVSVLSRNSRFTDLGEAAQIHAQYKQHANDPFLKQVLSVTGAPRPVGNPPPPQTP